MLKHALISRRFFIHCKPALTLGTGLSVSSEKILTLAGWFSVQASSVSAVYVDQNLMGFLISLVLCQVCV